ncbi:unnamed protein product [Lampetra planeri]
MDNDRSSSVISVAAAQANEAAGKMKKLMILVALIHLLALALLLASTLDNVAWVQAVQAFMILAILASLASLAMFMVEVLKMKCGKKFCIPGLLQCSAGLCALIGASIFTARSHAHHWANACQQNFTLVHSGHPCFNVTLFHPGHNGTPFFLAWSTVPLLIISGLLYTFLEKKESFPVMATK